MEWAKHQAVGGWDVKPGRIAIDATCDHPAVEQALRRLIVDINKELVGCRRVLADMETGLRGCGLPSRYGLQLPEEVAPVAIRARTDDSGRPLGPDVPQRVEVHANPEVPPAQGLLSLLGGNVVAEQLVTYATDKLENCLAGLFNKIGENGIMLTDERTIHKKLLI